MSRRLSRRGWRAWLAVAVTAMFPLAGCASTVVTRGAPEQAPLVERRAAAVGVFYPGVVRSGEYRSEVVRMPYGAASVARLDHAFSGLFTSVTRLPDWPPWRSQAPPVEAILEVEEGVVEVTLGRESIMQGAPTEVAGVPDRVLAVYRACLYRPDGRRIACWESLAESSNQRDWNDSVSESVRKGAERAMSDAVAGLMLRMGADPAIGQWSAAPPAGQTEGTTAAATLVALIGWPLEAQRREEAEVVSRCLRTAIEREAPGVHVLDERVVREALYPLLEPSTQPPTEEALAALLARADVQSRLRRLGVSRLLAFAGGAAPAEGHGGGICGYYGCYGYAWRSESARLDAVLWDLGAAARRQAFEASATGTTPVPILVLPIPLPARTLEHACDRLGQRVAASLKAPVPPPARP